MLYNKLLENVVLTAGDLLTGGSYITELRKRRKEQWYSHDQLQQLQTDRLRKLLVFANEKIPFYRNISIDPKADPRLELKKFPVMYKPVIKENIDLLVSAPKETLIREASSGSSGVQGVVYLNKEAQSSQRAIQTLWWEWAGYKAGHKIIQTGITPNRGFVKGMKDLLFKTDYVQAYNLDSEFVISKLRELEKEPRRHFMGYASSLYVFAQLAREQNINNIKFESIVSWGDKMFPHFRELIEKQFNSQVFDTYACTEGIMIAAQCKNQNYHLMTGQSYIELLDEHGNEVPDGEMGFVVATRFDNFAMPLIRYYLGDLAIKAEKSEQCSCGRNMPHLKKIIGRDTDIVKTRSGKFMVVHAFTGIFEHIGEVKQFRVVQHNPDGIDIEVIPDKGYSGAVAALIREKISGYLKEDFPINIIEVSQISPTASGKPQIIKSFLKQSAVTSAQ